MGSRESKRKAKQGGYQGKTRIFTEEELQALAARDAKRLAKEIQLMGDEQQARDSTVTLEEKLETMIQAKVRQLLAQSQEEDKEDG